MIEAIVLNIISNSMFPVKVFEQTLHIYYEGKWYRFENMEFERLLLVKELVKKSLGQNMPASKIIDSVHRELMTDIQVLDNYIQMEGTYINLKNSVINIRKDGEIVPLECNRKYGFRWSMPIAYDEGAICPQFLLFLSQVIGEEEAIMVLQEYLGYVFLSHKQLNLEKALWLFGNGANGKSVLTHIISLLYGAENTAYLDLPNFSDPEKCTLLKGKIVNITQDASNRIDPSKYKTIVSGETLQTRTLYKGTSELKVVPKLIISLNTMPTVRNGVDAFMRRVILIPFNKTITEEEKDLFLKDKLEKEIAGIFNFALKGLTRVQKQGHFTYSKLIDNAVSEYKGELDILDDFLNDFPIEKVDKSEGGFIVQTELYRKVEEWTKSNGVRNPYPTPRALRDQLIRAHRFMAYKNNTLYGIRGKWSISPLNNSDYIVPIENDIPYQ